MYNIIILSISILSFSVSCSTNSKPKHPLAGQLKEGNQYARDGLYREAIITYRKILESRPNFYPAHRTIGIVYVKVGNYNKAIDHLEKSITNYRDDFQSNFFLGESYRALANFDDAIFRYKKALKIRPGDIRASKALAWSYHKIRYYKASLNTLKKISISAPHDTEVSVILARTLLKTNRISKALNIINSAKTYAKSSQMPYLESVEGDCYFHLKNYSKAIKIYRSALKTQPLLAGALLGLGKSLLKKGNNDASQAISYIKRATRLKPHLAEGLYILGKLYEKSNRKLSLTYYKRFLKIAESDPEFIKEVQHTRTNIDKLE